MTKWPLAAHKINLNKIVLSVSVSNPQALIVLIRPSPSPKERNNCNFSRTDAFQIKFETGDRSYLLEDIKGREWNFLAATKPVYLELIWNIFALYCVYVENITKYMYTHCSYVDYVTESFWDLLLFSVTPMLCPYIKSCFPLSPKWFLNTFFTCTRCTSRSFVSAYNCCNGNSFKFYLNWNGWVKIWK